MLLKEVTSIPLLDKVFTTRCYINSEKQKTPISIESLIAASSLSTSASAQKY